MNESSRPPYAPWIRDAGLTGMLVTFGDRLTEAANDAAMAFRAAVDAAALPGVCETSTSLVSAFVVYDPQVLARAALRDKLAELAASRDWAAAGLPAGRHLWTIPAALGDTEGPQLNEAAALAGITPDQAIAELTGMDLRVMTIGFAPGQPYLGSLPAHWDIPRQSRLTARVPAGAIAVAVRQAVLFTNATPTGWRLVGRTAFRTFRPDSDAPFPLRAGDAVRFSPVTAAELARIASADRSGNGGATRADLS